LTIGFLVNAQIINFPDANFKAKLLSANTINSIASFQIPVYNSAGNTWSVPSYNKIDVNNDGEIQVSEAQMVTYLDVGYSSISSLTGIEYFTNLNILYCRNNQLTSLNLSPNTNLKVLNCIYNQITNLDLISCTNLLFLNCNYNQLVNLNLSSNNLLEYLFCENNQITTLDLITNNNLKYLSCKTNSINNLQVLLQVL
jgi:Leucine-rich repeat (LRR) protein